MKKIFLLLLLTVVVTMTITGCKKRSFTAEGPTDVRIHNQTGQVIEEVTVITTDDPSYVKRVHNYGTVTPGAYTEYFRFDIAFTEADITLRIGSVSYSTPAAQFDYLTYIGPDRITYRLTIADQVNHILDIETIIEEPIDDL
ncbi:MAG: hypothetical protein GX622_13185 [Bacteroidales bacterium]|nr:hypothetical protein [Bacteroidales bacterium]